jgi:hypothetical protein
LPLAQPLLLLVLLLWAPKKPLLLLLMGLPVPPLLLLLLCMPKLLIRCWLKLWWRVETQGAVGRWSSVASAD